MSVSILRGFLCWVMLVLVPVSLLGQSVPNQTAPDQIAPSQTSPNQTGAAILHTQGGVWVNGYEALDSSAVFPGDLLETKPSSSASLTLDGSTVLIQPESVAKLQTNLLELDHGSVFVGTSKSFKVRVNCLTVVPVLNEWTQYEVSNLNGNVQVAARKDDVNVDRGADRRKPSVETESSHGSTVHEAEQKSFNLSEICGAPGEPTAPSSILNPKWIAVGAAGGGLLICVLLCRGGSHPVKPNLSQSAP
ncbi:MAG TPA: hypothetical protein VIX37_22515 [Candidatus Sulfotelmatobacter sp.]